MRQLIVAVLALAWALVGVWPVWAGQVPAPINAPASVGSGDVLGASGTNPQQAADTGIAASSVVTLTGSQTLTNKTLTAPTLTTPALGTPASGNLSNTDHIPVNQATGILLAANGGAGTINGALKANGSGVVSQAAAADLSDTKLAQTFTPAVTFATPGDVSVAYTTQTGRYTQVGPLVCFFVNLAFTATYTTATGNFEVTMGTLPAPSISGLAFQLNTLGAITWPGATDTQINVIATTTLFLLRGFKSGAGSSNFTQTNVVSGVAYTMTFSGCYPSA